MKKVNRLLIALMLILAAIPAWASQNSVVLSTTSPYPGLTMLGDANNAYNTLITNNSGASAPGTTYSDMFWADTTNNLLKFTPNGSTWYPTAAFGGGYWDGFVAGNSTLAPTSGGSSNAYTLTLSPVPSALVIGRRYPFKANFQNTSTATLSVNGITAHAITKQGAVGLSSGDIPNGAEVDDIWDGTEFQMISQLGNSANGTVTNVATGSGICGGPITSTGTASLCTQANDTVLANISGSTAAPSATAAPVLTSYGLGPTSAAAGSFTGMHSPSSTQLALAANGADAVTIFSDQGVTVGSPTGGDKGAGTVNMTNCYINGVACNSNVGAEILLHTVSCSGGCSTITFNNTYITGTYPEYKVRYYGVYNGGGCGGAAALGLKISTNNGSSYLSSGYSEKFDIGSYSSTGTYLDTMGSGSTVYFSTAQTIMGSVDFYVGGTASPEFFMEAHGNTATGFGNYYGNGTNTTTTAVNAIQFFDTSSCGANFFGAFSIYGITH